MGHRKKIMQDMVTQVNNNSNGKGNILSPATQPWDTVSAPRKKSEAKKEGEHGPKHVHNPDKIVYDSRTNTNVRKEDFVRSGDRKKRNLKEIKLAAIAAAGMAGLSRLGNKK